MSKIFNLKSLLTVLIVIGIVALIFVLTRSLGKERTVSASVSSTEVVIGEPLLFADSTSGASVWLWEFGNGDYSNARSGSYTFLDEGRYQIRLRVDDRMEKLFLVRVRPREGAERLEHLIHINAPEAAVQGEYILFSADGNDKEWKWEFGESGIIDSREKSVIYAYRNHGKYRVRLTTEKTQYPIYHQIEILPKYMEVDSLDVMTMAALDIKEKLQNIVNGKSFNTNYNHILKKYLCSNPDILVTVNNEKRNDFYSYCQGLRIAGRNNTIIATVYVESGKPETSCLDHILVLQYDKTSGTPDSPPVRP